MDRISQDVVVRPASAADADVLAALRVEFLTEVHGGKPGPDGLESSLRKYFREMIPSGRFVGYVGVVEGRIVATSGLVFYHCPPSHSNPAGREGHIMNMYTRPQWRGRGIARRLLEAILKSAQEAGCGRVSLDAEAKARGLYERMGFGGNGQAMRRVVGDGR